MFTKLELRIIVFGYLYLETVSLRTYLVLGVLVWMLFFLLAF